MTNSNGLHGPALMTGPFERNMNTKAFMHPATECVGTADGPGQHCSMYGSTRRTMQSIGDPVVMQRSYKSSASPASASDTTVDTLSNPPHKRLRPRPGKNITNFHVRDFHDTSTVLEHDYSSYHLFPKSWPENQFSGVNAVGGFRPSREQARANANKQYRLRSPGSYGSYGAR